MPGMATTYDILGTTYSQRRSTDPHIASAIALALRGCVSVLNVGAGTGSYEPRGNNVVAIEPSWTMIRQRAGGAAPVVRGRAEALPFSDGSFDGVLGVLTVHHWTDQAKGFAECARVARKRIVFFTIDPAEFRGYWLYEYFPSLAAIDSLIFPSMTRFADAFGSIDVVPVPIPEDCSDGFLGAYWRRPEAFLDPIVRKSVSTFSKMSKRDLDLGLEKLQADMESGVWAERHAHPKNCGALDLGYRIVSCGRNRTPGSPS